MGIVYALLPLSIILASCGLAAYLWAARNGQYEDLDAETHRLLFDKEAKKPENQQVSTVATNGDTD